MAFQGTRVQFMERGFPAAERLQSYDLKGGGRRAKGVTPNQVVTKAVEEVFLPRAARVFDSAPHINIILLAEDDCTLRSQVHAWTVRNACGDLARRSATWLGYYTIRHEPTGAHLIGFSRRALLSFQEHVRAIHCRDHLHLHGFDAFLKNLIPQGRIRLAHQSVAYQRGHRLQKRR